MSNHGKRRLSAAELGLITGLVVVVALATLILLYPVMVSEVSR